MTAEQFRTASSWVAATFISALLLTVAPDARARVAQALNRSNSAR